MKFFIMFAGFFKVFGYFCFLEKTLENKTDLINYHINNYYVKKYNNLFYLSSVDMINLENKLISLNFLNNEIKNGLILINKNYNNKNHKSNFIDFVNTTKFLFKEKNKLFNITFKRYYFN